MQKRNLTLDIAKCILALFVIGLHCGFLKDISTVLSQLTVNGVFRTAVPLFLLINGYFFADTLANNHTRTWISRIFTLYITWMLIYSPLWFSFSFTTEAFAKNLFLFVIGYHHLWYIAGLLLAGIATVFIAKLNNLKILHITICLFLAGVCIQYTSNYLIPDNSLLARMTDYNWSHRNFALFSLPFFLIGLLIKRNAITEKLTKNRLYWLSAVAFIGLLLESYINLELNPNGGGLDNMLSLGALCPLLFILACKIKFDSNNKILANFSTAMYLSHSMIITGLIYASPNISSLELLISTILLSSLAALILVSLHRKFRFLL